MRQVIWNDDPFDSNLIGVIVISYPIKQSYQLHKIFLCPFNTKTTMKLLSVLLTSLSSTSLVTALTSNPEGSPQDISNVICTGRPRTECAVELDVPNGCEETDSNCPIVFFFHGSGGTNSRFKNKSGVHSAGYIGI